ncbi:MAG: hypothetical protein QME52_14125, partial [Bacteroidota bacterium]|nr:hypothetical protein [Bacteroidota bacterium]
MKQIYIIMFSVISLANITYSQTALSLPQARDSLEDFQFFSFAHCQPYDLPAKWDLPECACFDPGTAPWPLTTLDVAPVLPRLARKSVGLQASCYKHRGQPYWQVQLQYTTPEDAHFAAHDRIFFFRGTDILC